MDYANAIFELGILVVIAALFLKQSKELNKNFHDKFDMLFDEMVTKNKQNTVDVETEKRLIALNESVNQVLETAMYSVDAGRAFLISYHNGGHDVTNISYLKMSMTNEFVRPGVAPMQNEFIGQFRDTFAYTIKQLNDTGVFEAENIDDVKTKDYALYIFLSQRGVTRLYLVSVCDTYGRVIGFLGIEYLKKDILIDSEKIHKVMTKSKTQIEIALDMYKKGV